MKHPASLRATLSQWVKDLSRNPDKLHMFIEKGRVSTKAGRSASFEYHYTLQIIITDFSEPVDVLVVPILIWAKEHQPDLIHAIDKQSKAIEMEVEIVDHDKIDISLSLDLSERVIVMPTAGGSYSCNHVAEPQLTDETGPTGWSLFVGGVEFTIDE